MNHGELSSLYQLGVGLNLGFGAIVVFAEPARRQFENSLGVIESRILQLTDATEIREKDNRRVDDLYAMNRAYLTLLASTKILSLESYIWQSIPARLTFMLGAIASFFGLVLSAYRAHEFISWYNLATAVGVNLVPMVAALLLFIVSCWYQYKIFPRVEQLQEQLFGRRSLISGRP
jgi:hypothetical protein